MIIDFPFPDFTNSNGKDGTGYSSRTKIVPSDVAPSKMQTANLRVFLRHPVFFSRNNAGPVIGEDFRH